MRKYVKILAISMLAALVVIPASLSSFASDQENSQSDDVLNQIVPNKASDRNAMGDSHMDTRVCPPAAPGEATCIAIERDYFKRGVKIEQNAANATPNAATPNLTLVGFNSAKLRSAYGILTTEQGSPATVIAIVDAYGYPSALTDLNTYRANYGVGVNPAAMSACSNPANKPTFPTASATKGCFAQISGVTGLTTNLPKSNTGWNQEGALDIEMATAICPKCSILFVAANSASFADLNKAVGQAINYAKVANVVAISNSYGGADFAETGLAPDNYQAAAALGVAVTASSGDSGYGAQSPASFTNVIGVGGTSLTLDTNGARTSEIIWTSAGSGCSTLNQIPTQQTTLGTTGCGKKAVSDISAVANPNTGVGVIYGGKVYQFGGTSVSSPIIASIFAVADYKPTQGTYAGASLYSKANATTNIYDVVGGAKNGNCPTATANWCTTGTGWDGPTGLGAPLNTGAFH
jgi:subtilase family serine protease